MRKTVIFDLDDTLVNHDRMNETKYISEYLGFPYTEDFSKAFYDSLFGIRDYFLGKTVTKKKMALYFEKNIPDLRKYNKSGYLLMKAMEVSSINIRNRSVDRTLHHLQVANVEMFVLTNWFYNSQVRMLKNFKYLDYFSRVFAWDDFYAKPDERAILKCIGNGNPKDFVFVGDSLYDDVLCANKAGVISVWYNPNRTINVSTIQPDYTITDMMELLQIATI